MKTVGKRWYAYLMEFALVGVVGALPTFVGNASAAPSIPQGLTAEAGDDFVHCSWSAVPGTNVTYALYRSHAESSNLVAIASNLTTTAHVDGSAVNGTAYRYAVTARDATGESGRSTHALANPVGKRNVLIFYAVWANETTKSINPSTGDCWIMTEAYSGYPAWNWWGKPYYAAVTGDGTIKNNYKMYFGTPNTPNNALLDWHADLLTDAGVDVVVLDLTNGTQTDIVNGAKAVCKRFGERRALGLPTPKVVLWVKDEPTLQHIKTNLLDVYPAEVFFDYLGKKLVCGNNTGSGTPAIPTSGLWGNYTSRRLWALGAVGATGNVWSFKTTYATPPLPFMFEGKPEQMAAPVGCQSSYMTTDGINPTAGAIGRQNGAHFNTYMNAAILAGPRFLFVHSWNEWTAQNLNQTPGQATFVDQWRTEYSSDIEPMAGGHGWDYYFLMKDRIAEYKDPYRIWFMERGLSGAAASRTADLEPDGLNNYHEYIYGGNPVINDTGHVSPALVFANDRWEYIYRRRVDDATLKYDLLQSSNLEGGWTYVGNRYETGAGAFAGGVETVTNLVSSTNGQQFFKLRVGTINPPSNPEGLVAGWEFNSPGDTGGFTGNSHINGLTVSAAVSGPETVLTCADITGIDPMLNYNQPITGALEWDRLEIRARQLSDNPGAGGVPVAWNSSGTMILPNGTILGLIPGPATTITPQADQWIVATCDLSTITGSITSLRLDVVGNNAAKNFEVDYIRIYRKTGTP